MSTQFDKPLRGFRYAQIRVGDTLQLIALRELGDATRWPELIALNDLTPPYIAARPIAGERVLLYGGDIVIPALAEIVTADSDPNGVFGIDCQLVNGQLAAEGGDFMLVSGADNLKQAIENVVATDQGELIFHPLYGCGVHRLLGRASSASAPILAAGYVKSAIAADQRVASVLSSTAQLVGDTINVQASFQPVSGAPVSISRSI